VPYMGTLAVAGCAWSARSDTCYGGKWAWLAGHGRSCPKYDNSRHFGPHFEEVRGGVEPWSMALWKALAEFLLSIIELRFLSLTVEAIQSKTCQNSQPSGVGRSL